MEKPKKKPTLPRSQVAAWALKTPPERLFQIAPALEL